MIYRLEVETEGVETYCLEADSEAHARKLLEEGGLTRTPVFSEITGTSISAVKECSGAEDCP